MPARTRALGGAAAALALVTVLLLMPLPHSWEGPWQSKFFDLGHIPLFFTLTLFLWLMLGRSWAWALGISLGMGGLAELVQDYFGRTGNLTDFLRDGLGAAAAVVAVHAWQGPRTALRLAGHALGMVALVAWPIADAAPWLLDAYAGYRDFPTLADFTDERQLLRWHCGQVRLERVPGPEQPSEWSARLDFLPGPKKYPGAVLEPIVRDWSGWRQLCCSFTVVGEPLVLVVSIRGRDAAGKSAHYQFEKPYAVGAHTVRVDLDTVARLALPTRLDVSDVRYFQFFIYRPDRARRLMLHRVWLE